MTKFYPLAVFNEDNFMNLNKTTRLTYYEIYGASNDYGIFENSKKNMYLELNEEDINNLVSNGYLLRLYNDNSVYAITHWNVINAKLRYRSGNNYSELLGIKANGKYFLKGSSENKIHYLFENNEPNTKTDFD